MSTLPPDAQCPECGYTIGVPNAAACPECGLSARDVQNVSRARAEAHRQWPLIGSAIFLLPVGVLVPVSFIAYLFTEAGSPPFMGVITVVWMLMCVTSLGASIFAARPLRVLWCVTSMKMLPLLGMALVVVPINWSLSPLGTGALFWAALVCTLGAVVVSNILAWKLRRREVARFLLPAGIGAAAFLFYHVTVAVVFGAIAIMSAIGDRVFILPGQQ